MGLQRASGEGVDVELGRHVPQPTHHKRVTLKMWSVGTTYLEASLRLATPALSRYVVTDTAHNPVQGGCTAHHHGNDAAHILQQHTPNRTLRAAAHCISAWGSSATSVSHCRGSLGALATSTRTSLPRGASRLVFNVKTVPSLAT